jgi:S-DNA-T family DNA segregation ATPase FtsK/SpoIIIE
MAKAREKNKAKKGGAKAKRSSNKGRGRGKQTPPAQPLIQLTLDQKLDILGVVLMGIAAVTIFSFLSPNQSELTGAWLGFLRNTFGFGVFIVPLVLAAAGLWLLLRSFERTPTPAPAQVIGFAITFFAALATLDWFDRALSQYEGWGGAIGAWFTNLIVSAVGDFGSAVVLIVWWLLAVVFLFDISPSEMLAALGNLLKALRGEPAPSAPTYTINQPMQSNRSARVIGGTHDAELPPVPAPPSTRAPRIKIEKQPKVSRVAAPEPAPQAQPEPEVEEPAGPLFPRIIGGSQTWQLPNIEDTFITGNEAPMSEDDIREKVQIIEQTLNSFGVEGKVVEVNSGPVITQFGVEPGFVSRGGKQTKVKVSKISSLADDLALALAARSIRIEAPVPGRNIVGIEVPNAQITSVALRDVIESGSFQNINAKLRIALGQDVSGNPIAADLALMPHLLIAGTTGSGKSVCINAIIASLLAFNSPDEMKLLMVDPKRVELTSYTGIPHLIAPVIVDLERVVGVLKWVTNEMDNRYKRFAQAGARNIVDFNARLSEEDAAERMPFIVLVIDELADLMMMAPDETEKTICRLAQMARATGIHLIIATQRPSVDVVTGLIKANFPARISFAVASSTDSRVILDTTGAERLLGRGDMLFISPDSGAPLRAQGCFVSDAELRKLVQYWRNAGGQTSQAASEPVRAQQQPLWEKLPVATPSSGSNQEDDLLERAIEVVRLQRRASISLLQRRLRIGYTRAARLIDLMEEKRIVGPAAEGSRWREVLVDSLPHS